MIIVKVCEYCGEKFLTKSKTKACCSMSCARQLTLEKRMEYGQLCWHCAKACGGCAWSDKDLPVEGWEAEGTVVKDEEGQFESYHVKKCPEFIKG